MCPLESRQTLDEIFTALGICQESCSQPASEIKDRYELETHGRRDRMRIAFEKFENLFTKVEGDDGDCAEVESAVQRSFDGKQWESVSCAENEHQLNVPQVQKF